MDKELKKYLQFKRELKETQKEIEKGEEALHRHQYQVQDYLKSHTMQEAKEYFKDYYKETQEEEIQKKVDLYNKRKMQSLKVNLQFNNFTYLFFKQYEEEFKKVIDKYEGKSIGEKTKEKMQEEIKSILYQNKLFANCEIYPYFSGDTNNYDLSLEIREKKEDSFIYDLKYKIEKKTSFNCYDNETKVFYYIYIAPAFSYNYNCLNNLVYLEDITKEAKRIIKEEEKNKKKIEEKKEELKKAVKSYNNFIDSYNLDTDHDKQFKIDYTLYLY